MEESRRKVIFEEHMSLLEEPGSFLSNKNMIEKKYKYINPFYSFSSTNKRYSEAV